MSLHFPALPLSHRGEALSLPGGRKPSQAQQMPAANPERRKALLLSNAIIEAAPFWQKKVGSNSPLLTICEENTSTVGLLAR